MALNRFRIATATLILFNVVGTGVTWAFHLSKPGASETHAILSGTEFTAPLIFVALWIAFILMMSSPGRAATVGLWLMTIFAAAFALGDLTELFKKNIGVSSTKWHFILAADVLSLALGLTIAVLGIATIVRSRRARTSPGLSASRWARGIGGR